MTDVEFLLFNADRDSLDAITQVLHRALAACRLHERDAEQESHCGLSERTEPPASPTSTSSAMPLKIPVATTP
jgi:hypothetical protein